MIQKFTKNIALAILILVPGISTLASDPSLQDILDRGDDQYLEPGKEYILNKPLKFRVEGQTITTRNAEKISDFATLRLAAGPVGTLVNAEGIPGIIIENIILDGNGSNLKTPDGKVSKVPLISMGKEGVSGQVIRRCMVINSRSAGGWAAIHVHENCSDILIEENIVFSAGVDVRGNGRSALEGPLGWGDGISTAGRNSIVRNNLVIDASDEGIMVQGAAGTLVEKNVISAISRKMLEDEYLQWIGWLTSTEENADMLRQLLTGLDEFRIRNDYLSPLDLQEFRTELWTGLIIEENEKIMKASGKWPTAVELYRNILEQLINQ